MACRDCPIRFGHRLAVETAAPAARGCHEGQRLQTAEAAAFGLSHAPVYKRRMARPPRSDFPLPALITTSDALDAFCQRMRNETFITVDTEFMRERTYWPDLCLVQIAGETEVAVIDARPTASTFPR